LSEGNQDVEHNLLELHGMGLRVLTITWNNSNDLAISCRDKKTKDEGLSETGKNVIRTCNNLGIAIDVSHSREKMTCNCPSIWAPKSSLLLTI